MDRSPPGSSVHGILQAIILEWVARPSSRRSSQPRDQTQVSHTAGRFFTIWATRGNPRILERVAYPFSRGSSWPRSWTSVSCIAAGFFTSWATREAPQTCVFYFQIQYSFFYAMLECLTPNVIKKSNLGKFNKIKVVLVTRSCVDAMFK